MKAPEVITTGSMTAETPAKSMPSDAGAEARTEAVAGVSTGTVKTAQRLFLLVGGVALTMALSGCLESTDTRCYRPGVYQGAPDPLIGNSDPAALQARFAGQTDR